MKINYKNSLLWPRTCPVTTAIAKITKSAHVFISEAFLHEKKFKLNDVRRKLLFLSKFRSLLVVRKDESLVGLVESRRCLKFLIQRAGNTRNIVLILLIFHALLEIKLKVNSNKTHKTVISKPVGFRWLRKNQLLWASCLKFQAHFRSKKMECSWNVLLNKFLHLTPPQSMQNIHYDQLQSFWVQIKIKILKVYVFFN